MTLTVRMIYTGDFLHPKQEISAGETLFSEAEASPNISIHCAHGTPNVQKAPLGETVGN